MKSNLSLIIAIICLVATAFFIADSIKHERRNEELSNKIDSLQKSSMELHKLDSIVDAKFVIYIDSLTQVKDVLSNAIIQQHAQTEIISKQVSNLRKRFDSTVTIERPNF